MFKKTFMARKRKKEVKIADFVIIILCGVVYLLKDKVVTYIRSYDVIETRIYLSLNTLGIDTQYRGYIDWSEVAESNHPIKFVIIKLLWGLVVGI